jgi:arsenical pump membrane protein
MVLTHAQAGLRRQAASCSRLIDWRICVSHGSESILIWIIVGAAIAGVIARPFRWPEAIWAVGGAILLVLARLISASDALHAVGKGADVYLFLAGMMLLSEVARRAGLFDWVATYAVNAGRGSPRRLFVLVYAVGTVVTIFLSNDATAVVLTPAVFAATRKAKVEPLPYLFVCAFIANAASFVLPISNPANLVLYADRTPVLANWLVRFALPSLLSIVATFAALRFVERESLLESYKSGITLPPLSPGGFTALGGIVSTGLVLLVASALDMQLGLPTAVMGALTMLVVLLRDRASPWPVLKEISWSVILLVAGLFVLVEALTRTGLVDLLAAWLQDGVRHSASAVAAAAGVAIALASNLMNNLPAGLIASLSIAKAHAPTRIVDALLIGVDLGPNLSVTGSLATILWLLAIRREGETVTFWRFFKVGVVVMPPALLLALGARLFIA